MTTVTLPTSQVEFEEALHDKDRMKAVWEDGPDGWADFCCSAQRLSQALQSLRSATRPASPSAPIGMTRETRTLHA